MKSRLHISQSFFYHYTAYYVDSRLYLKLKRIVKNKIYIYDKKIKIHKNISFILENKILFVENLILFIKKNNKHVNLLKRSKFNVAKPLKNSILRLLSLKFCLGRYLCVSTAQRLRDVRPQFYEFPYGINNMIFVNVQTLLIINSFIISKLFGPLKGQCRQNIYIFKLTTFVLCFLVLIIYIKKIFLHTLRSKIVRIPFFYDRSLLSYFQLYEFSVFFWQYKRVLLFYISYL